MKRSADAAIERSSAPPSDTPHRPLYFEDIVQIRRDAGRDSQEFLEARDRWVKERFQTVHYEHYSKDVAAGVVEVTPCRPPYDYRGQQWQHLFHRKDPEWHYWRETFVSSPPDPCYVRLNAILNAYSDLYLRCTYYTDPEDSAYCHRLLRTGLRECVDAYAGWCAENPSLKEEEDHLSVIEQRYAHVEEAYRLCAARRTVTQYSFGMLLGIILVPLVIWLNVRAFSIIDDLQSSTVQLPAGLDVAVHLGCAMGGLGAACSVLSRINSARIDLDRESTRHGFLVWLNPVIQRGVARIVIGALFGVAAAWLLFAELFLPRIFLGTSEDRLVLAGVAAFVAGFSERFIPDVILRKAQQSNELVDRRAEVAETKGPPSTRRSRGAG